MLKFKEIKRNIMNHQEKNISPLQESKKTGEPNGLSFKNFKNQPQYSPLAKNQINMQNNYFSKFDTDKKTNVSPFLQNNFISDTKENCSKNVYYNKGTTFGDLSGKKLEFGPPKRKTIHAEPSEYYDNSYENSAAKHNSNLSFANLLMSKKPSNNSKGKIYLQSERKNDRQSSISKLKDKLFGMKKLIS